MGRADGGDAHAGAVHRAGVDLRAKVRRHPAARVQDRARTSGCSRATGCRRHLPALAGAIASLPVHEVILDGEATLGRPSVAYHVFDVLLARRPRPDVAAARRAPRAAGRAAAAAAASARGVARRPGAVGARLQRGLGGSHREAARRAVRAPPIAALVEDEVRGDAGAGGRRVHRSAGSTRRPRRVARRLLRRDDFVFAGKVGTGFDTRLLLELRARLRRARDPEAAIHESASGCRACARTGCAPRSSCRSPSSNGRCTASCATRGCCGVRADKAAREVVRETA